MPCITFNDVRHLLSAAEERRYRQLRARVRGGRLADARAFGAFVSAMVEAYEDDVLARRARVCGGGARMTVSWWHHCEPTGRAYTLVCGEACPNCGRRCDASPPIRCATPDCRNYVGVEGAICLDCATEREPLDRVIESEEVGS